MAEELNSQDSSQPSLDTSVGEGTNAEGKPSEPVAQPGMTPSQSADYYNKTQQIAAQRRELESERARFEQERAQHYQQYGNPQGGYNQNQNPNYGALPAGQNYPQNQNKVQIDPQAYSDLVEQFGREGADALLRNQQQLIEPVQRDLLESREEARNAKIYYLEQSINLKGQDLFGKEEWKAKGQPVMDFVRQYGVGVEQAWYAVHGASMRQAGVDAAYQAQQTKEQGNVSESNVQPRDTSASDFDSLESAMEAAWQQHGGG